MNKNNFAIKFKRYAVLGISLLGLAAIGCGGGNGTLVSDPTFNVPAPAPSSLQRVAGANRSLAPLPSGDLSVYSLDGVLLQGPVEVTLPHTIKVSGSLKTKAGAQGGLVVRINNGNVDYTTVVKLDSTDLASNGAIQENGGDRQEAVDSKSTVRTALIEAELERETGQTVRLGTKASAELKKALADAVDVNNSGAGSVAVGDIAGSLKTAAADANSLVNQIAQAASVVGTSANVNAQDSIRNFLRKGAGATEAQKQSLKKARKLMKASTKLSRQARKRSSAAAKTLLASLVSSTPTKAATYAAAASVVAAALDLSEKTSSAALKTAAEDLLGGTLEAAVTKATAEVLPEITTEVAADLNAQNSSDEMAELVGNVIAASNTADAGLAVLNRVLDVADDTTKKKLFGASLAATADNTAAAKSLIQNVASDSLKVADAINAVAGDVDVADVVDVVADVIEDLGTVTLKGLDSNLNDLVSNLSNLDGEDLAAIASQTSFTVNDTACVKGFPCGESSAALTVKKGDVVSLYNSSISTDGDVYAYVWTVGTGVGTDEVKSSEYLTFTAAASGVVTLVQSRSSVEVSTFTLTLTVAEVLKPVVNLSSTEVRLKPGKSGTLGAEVFDPEGGTLTSAVTVGDCAGAAVTGLTASKSADAGAVSVTVSATANVATGVYCGVYTATAGDLYTNESFEVFVDAYAPTKLSVSGVADVTTGTTSVITLSGYSENPSAAGTLTLVVMNAETDAIVASTTASVAAGTVTTKVSVTNDTEGVFIVSASATGAATKTYAYSVSKVGAPSYDYVHVNGFSVNSGSSLEFTTTAGGTVTVDVDALASVQDGSISTYMVVAEYASTEISAGTTNGQNMILELGAGSWVLVVNARSNANIDVVRAIEVNVTELRQFEVTGVALSGVTTNTVSTSVSGSKYVVDASGVQGLSLANEGLLFTITGTGVSSAFAGSDYELTVNLKTPVSDLREASITVSGATIAAGQTGYDLTAATQMIFKGTKSDGVTQATFTAPSSAITNFDYLFTESANGITIDINALKAAVKEDVISSAGSFYQSIDTLSGSGMTVEVKVTAPNFSFNDGTKSFNTFVIENITVE